MVQVDGHLDQIEAYSDDAGHVTATVIALKQPIQVGCRDADAAVGDGNDRFVGGHRRLDLIRALEDAEDYRAFEAAITADYDAQSAVERELVLRLARLLWRLRRATTMEAGLFEIQADHLSDLRKEGPLHSASPQIVYAMFGQPNSVDAKSELSLSVRSGETDTPPCRDLRFAGLSGNPSVDLARCFLRLANLSNFALDPLSRYEKPCGAKWAKLCSRLAP